MNGDNYARPNKMIGLEPEVRASDTPRMKAAQLTAMEHMTGDVWRVGCDLERELTEANEWVKRIEEFLVEKSNNAEQQYSEERNDGYGESVASSRALYLAFKEALSQFRKAKEDGL